MSRDTSPITTALYRLGVDYVLARGSEPDLEMKAGETVHVFKCLDTGNVYLTIFYDDKGRTLEETERFEQWRLPITSYGRRVYEKLPGVDYALKRAEWKQARDAQRSAAGDGSR